MRTSYYGEKISRICLYESRDAKRIGITTKWHLLFTLWRKVTLITKGALGPLCILIGWNLKAF